MSSEANNQTPSQHVKNQTQHASFSLGSSKLKLGEPTFGMSTLIPKQNKENSAILVEDSEPSASKAKAKDLRNRTLNKSANQ